MNYNNSHFKSLLQEPIVKLIEIFRNVVIEKSPIKNSNYIRNQKYSLDDYIIGIIDVLRYNHSWNSYSGIINGNTLRKKHYEWVKLNIYEEVYKRSLNKYLKVIPKTEEFKYQAIDSTFIRDNNGSKESGYSGIYKERKGESSKGIKITSIVTTSGIPLSTNIVSANKHDCTVFPKVINNMVVECNTYKYHNHNRYKQYFIGDPAYDTKDIAKILKKKGYTQVIKQNPRRIKKKRLLRPFNESQKTIYRKRMIIENYHSWLKRFIKIKSLNERLIENYMGLLYLGISIIINRRIISH
jgi:hypothetical protein